MSFFLVLLSGCIITKPTMLKDCNSLIGKYSYQNDLSTYFVYFEFFRDKTFIYESTSGMQIRYSSGTYSFNDKKLTINSVYPDTLIGITPVSWMEFRNEVLIFKKEKLIYKDYILKREK